MKKLLTVIFFFSISTTSFSQTTPKNRNIFIITTDGFRWQEVFTGADSNIVNNTKYVKDTSLIKNKFWDDDIDKRKAKLLPFFWNMIAKKGQLFGNRNFSNEIKGLYPTPQ